MHKKICYNMKPVITMVCQNDQKKFLVVSDTKNKNLISLPSTTLRDYLDF